MALGKESVLFVTVTNLVLTVVVVWAGVTLFVPDRGPDAPGDVAALKQRVEDLERKLSARGQGLTAIDELELELGDVKGRVAALEKAPRALSPAEALAAAEADPADAKPTPEQELMKGFGQMIQQQMKRQRERFIREVMNPTPESDARQARRIKGITDMIAQNLGLDERDKASVERILTEVDGNRREKLREIIQAEKSPEDVKYADVKKVLDDSFEEEDQMIGQTLSEEKAESYVENAKPFRQFIYVAAQAAFPATTDSGEKTSDK